MAETAVAEEDLSLYDSPGGDVAAEMPPPVEGEEDLSIYDLAPPVSEAPPEEEDLSVYDFAGDGAPAAQSALAQTNQIVDEIEDTTPPPPADSEPSRMFPLSDGTMVSADDLAKRYADVAVGKAQAQVITTPKATINQEDSIGIKANKAIYNSVTGLVDATTSDAGLTMLLNPVAGIAGVAGTAIDMIDRYRKDVAPTPPGSPLRYQFAADVATFAALPVVFHTIGKFINKGGERGAITKRQEPEGVQAQPEGRVEGGQAQEAGVSDSLQPAATLGPEEVIKSDSAQGARIAGELGMDFRGIQKTPEGFPDMLMFEDPVAGGTIAHEGNTIADFKAHLESKRQNFSGRARGPSIVREEVTRDASGRKIEGESFVLNDASGKAQGAIEAEKLKSGEYQVYNVNVFEPLRRQGFATKLYQALVDKVGTIRSDSSVSKAAAGVYESLRKSGYKVERNPLATLREDGQWKTPDKNDSVYRVTKSSQPVEGGGETVPEAAPSQGGAAPPKVPEQFTQKSAVRQLLETQKLKIAEELKAPEAPPEGGALGFGGGKRAPKVQAIGKTPMGDKNFLKINAPIKRVGKGLILEGNRHVLGRTKNKVGQMLGKANRQAVDIEQEIHGSMEKLVREPMSKVPKARQDAAWAELSQYVREKEAGRPVPALSPDAQTIYGGVRDMYDKTGDIMLANNVQVRQRDGTFRPARKVPEVISRMLSREVQDAIADPDAHVALFDQLSNDLAAHRGITPEAAAAELRGNIGRRMTSNDHFSNIEMAREERLPESFMEHDLRNLVSRYLPSFSERMSQIISYGQRLGEREHNPQQPNLWDIARGEAGDNKFTIEWLNAAEDGATNVQPRKSGIRNLRRAQSIGNAALLSDPFTTVPRNLLSGLASTTERFGFIRSIRELHNAARTAKHLDAREIGVMRDDVGSFLGVEPTGDAVLDNWIRSTQEHALRASGFSGSEGFVRTHNMLVASRYAMDAAKALKKNPASRQAKEALAYFKRMDVDPEKIVTENGEWRTGAETRKFIRTSVRESQGGYRYDQVPVWANSTMGRFLYQYGRWGIQRTADINRNTLRPFFGETVEFRGQKMRSYNPFPLARLGLLTLGLGETFGAITSALFDRDRKDATFKEIGAAFSEDEMKGAKLLGERMMNDVINAGTLGFFTQLPDFFKTAKDQTRFKNPMEPPSLFGVRSLIQLTQKFMDQGGSLTPKDIQDAASQTIRGPKNLMDVAAAKYGDLVAGKDGALEKGSGEQYYRSYNDVRTLRNAARRWAKEEGMDVNPPPLGDFRKGKNAPTFESINRLLLAGDSDGAKAVAEDFIDAAESSKKAKDAIHDSVVQRHPFRAGQFASDKHQTSFMKWAQDHLPEQDFQQVERVIDLYDATAKEAGFTK